jgi:hypothetical protein
MAPTARCPRPACRRLLAKYSGHREKHTGDGVFTRFDGPTRAVRCSLELIPTLATRGIRIRAGVHTGECERLRFETLGLRHLKGLAEETEVFRVTTRTGVPF